MYKRFVSVVIESQLCLGFAMFTCIYFKLKIFISFAAYEFKTWFTEVLFGDQWPSNIYFLLNNAKIIIINNNNEEKQTDIMINLIGFYVSSL